MRQTDDILPFRTSLLGEYALLMAPPPLGLGLSENEVTLIARMSMEARFNTAALSKNWTRERVRRSLPLVPIVLVLLLFYFST